MRLCQIKEYTYTSLLGYVALLFWAAGGVLATIVKPIPTFEVISIAFAVCFGMTAIKLTLCKQWHTIKQPLILWLIGICGVYGNDILYIAAFKYAPPAQADLLNYLWPVLVVVFAGCLPREKFTLQHALAAGFGFIGTYFLVTNGNGFSDIKMAYLPGYLLATLDAIVWSVYCLVARHYDKMPTEIIGMYCGIGMLMSVLIHFNFETTVIPTHTELAALILMGLTTQGLAYFFWDIGIKKGNFKLLSIVSYGNPIIAIILLVAFGMTEPSSNLWIACFLVSLGGLVGTRLFDFKILYDTAQTIVTWFKEDLTWRS